MPKTATGNIYDYPKYYDVVFASDWRPEFDFLMASFQRYATRDVRRVFEPACGTARLLIRLARAGYDVSGNDLNPKAVAYGNDRLVRHGYPPRVSVGDMSNFRLSRPVDAAFNLINSFRHLPTQSTARSHLQCVAAAMRPGGIYLLGLHLSPTSVKPMQQESWIAQRGTLRVRSRMWTKEVDPSKRKETVGIRFEVQTPSQTLRLLDTIHFRTYTRTQFDSLLREVPDLERVATHDFGYDIDDPVVVDGRTEDVIYVLRKRGPARPARGLGHRVST